MSTKWNRKDSFNSPLKPKSTTEISKIWLIKAQNPVFLNFKLFDLFNIPVIVVREAEIYDADIVMPVLHLYVFNWSVYEVVAEV